jgi:hypothetical protein
MLRPGYLRGRGDVISRRVMKPPAWAQQLVAEVRCLLALGLLLQYISLS